MPGCTDKSRQYLRLAVENYKRAGAAESPKLKAKFSEIAAQYRDLALKMDDPVEGRASLRDSEWMAAKQNRGLGFARAFGQTGGPKSE